MGGVSGGSARGPASASWHVGSGVSGLFPALGCLRGCKQFRLGLAVLSRAPPSPALFVFVFLSEGAAQCLVLACLQATPCSPLLDSPGWTLPLPFSGTPCTPLLPFPTFTPFILPSPPPPLEPGSLPYHGEGEECDWRGLCKPYLPGLHWGPLCPASADLPCPLAFLPSVLLGWDSAELEARRGGEGKGGRVSLPQFTDQEPDSSQSLIPTPQFPFHALTLADRWASLSTFAALQAALCSVV